MTVAVDVLIPTLKPLGELEEQIEAIQRTRTTAGLVVASCRLGSAAENRNRCLGEASTSLLIMLDDDIEGFTPGWDARLVQPLLDDQALVMTAARLLRPDGKPGWMCGATLEDLDSPLVYVPVTQRTALPTAAIAFRDLGLRFDEGFIGSGFEDNDICHQFKTRRPDGRFAIVNGCRLVHRNEAKNQRGPFWKHNKAHFEAKWGKQ